MAGSGGSAGTDGEAWVWAKRAGGSGFDSATSVALQQDGSVYVTGYFNATARFEATELQLAGGSDVFLAKYAADGNLLWAERAGGPDFDMGSALALSDDAVYLTGHFNANATFGTTTLTSTGSYDVFLAKYASSGALIWAQRGGGEDIDYAKALAIGSGGAIYLAGDFRGTSNFGSATLTSAGARDTLLVKYDVAGNVSWAARAGGPGADYALAVAALPDGSACVTGPFEGEASFEAISLRSAGLRDVFIAKYGVDGQVLWAHSAGGVESDDSWALASDAAGAVFVAGQFVGSATFAETTLRSAGSLLNADVFVAKYDTNGELLWAERAGGTQDDGAAALAVLADGSVLVAGGFQGDADFGATTLTSAGDSDVFVAKLDRDGQWLWAERAGGAKFERATSLAALDASLYAYGHFHEGSATFGATTLTSVGEDDLFLAKMSLSNASARP